jgi:hypothetical protein
MKLLKYILLTIVLVNNSFVAFAQDVKDDVWVAEQVKAIGVIASVNGRITHGDRYKVRIEKSECKQGELFFSFYTTKDNKDILKLEGKAVKIKYNHQIINAEILYTQEFLLGHSAMFYLGFKPLDFIINFHKDRDNISVELIDEENFKASEYFDVLGNEWSLTNFESSLIQAQSLCRKEHGT